MKTKQFLVTTLTCASFFSTSMNANIFDMITPDADTKNIIRFIESNSLCVHERNDNQETPLHVVAKTFFDSDKENGEKVKIEETNFEFQSAENGVDVMKALMRHYINVNDQDANNDTALHIAIRSGMIHYMVYLLAETHADYSLKNNDHKSIFDIAIDKSTEFENSQAKQFLESMASTTGHTLDLSHQSLYGFNLRKFFSGLGLSFFGIIGAWAALSKGLNLTKQTSAATVADTLTILLITAAIRHISHRNVTIEIRDGFLRICENAKKDTQKAYDELCVIV